MQFKIYFIFLMRGYNSKHLESLAYPSSKPAVLLSDIILNSINSEASLQLGNLLGLMVHKNMTTLNRELVGKIAAIEVFVAQ
jgi:hypothetical protein